MPTKCKAVTLNTTLPKRTYYAKSRSGTSSGTYIYIRGKEKKRKEKKGVSYYAQQGKQIQTPQCLNDVNATGITTYNIKMKETTF